MLSVAFLCMKISCAKTFNFWHFIVKGTFLVSSLNCFVYAILLKDYLLPENLSKVCRTKRCFLQIKASHIIFKIEKHVQSMPLKLYLLFVNPLALWFGRS